MTKIMIVEDDGAIREELMLLLGNEGYIPYGVTDFRDIPDQAARLCPDLILLDIGLPGQDGFTLCASLKKTSRAAVIFVTGREDGMDEVRALSLGGDDYITKPYNIPVLLARIKAVLRRCGQGSPEGMESGGLRLDLAKGMAQSAEGFVLLSRNEVQILAHLMAHAGEIIPRADLIEALWNSRIYIDDNTLSVNVTRLRGKLAELGYGNAIRTRRGMGYQFEIPDGGKRRIAE